MISPQIATDLFSPWNITVPTPLGFASATSSKLITEKATLAAAGVAGGGTVYVRAKPKGQHLSCSFQFVCASNYF